MVEHISDSKDGSEPSKATENNNTSTRQRKTGARMKSEPNKATDTKLIHFEDLTRNDEALSDSEKPAVKDFPRLAYTLHEAAQILGVSYITAFRLVQRGLLKSSNALRTKLIPKSEMERFLKSTLQ